MEVVFHLFKILQNCLSPTRLDLDLLGIKYCLYPTILLLFPAAGQSDAGYIKIKVKLSPVEVNWGLAELGKKRVVSHSRESCLSLVYL